ncbi:MAG: tripartite tricarboxylate transporter TctB family protein [Alphaproteobacteria bacterium]|nr:tripartite tricarboxylate transporter TctB family protein [Alphaproteobacteria bacterium]MBU0798617.1 tripartite tricarboxylate transporter TctB family protein [Alphaproteobacteria bacterium]MBU0887244.1 tripartite tricarboxylate transporter TctB family protein [Alphaproteobacteria bacterium]MBU1811408.1 tripartite tricarboxylate transporter TctB family protein [Alphaproteobacteria bacterium]
MPAAYPAIGQSATILPDRGGARLELIFLAVVWAVTAALLWHGMSLQLWRDGTIGPGAYPVFALAGLLGLTTVLIGKALALRELRLYSPFQAGLQDDLRLRELADRMQSRLGVRIQVITQDGEGRFSALWKGIRAGTAGNALAVVSSDMTSLPNFHTAAFCQGRLEPVGGLFFDPDVLIVRPASEWQHPGDLWHKGTMVRLGFGHHVDIDHAIGRWLAAAHGLSFQPVYSDDIPALIGAIDAGEIDAAILSYSRARQAIATGQVRCIGILTEPGMQPPEAAEIPTFTDHGASVVSGHWAALMAPTGMPAEKKATLSAAFIDAAAELPPADKTDMSARLWRFPSHQEMTGIIEAQQLCYEGVGPRERIPDRLPAGKIVGLVVAIVGLAIFPIAMMQLGFVLSAFLYVASLTLLLWPRLTPAKAALSVAVAAFLSVGTYLLFSKVFSVALPTSGLLEGLLS